MTQEQHATNLTDATEWTSNDTDERFGDVVETTTLAESTHDAVLVGEPYDGGVDGRPGAREGPAAITAALADLGTHHLDAGPVSSVGDLGSVDVAAGESVTAVQNQVREVAAAVHDADALPVFLGGDGSLTYANVAPLLHATDGGLVTDGGEEDVGEVEHFDPTGGSADEADTADDDSDDGEAEDATDDEANEQEADEETGEETDEGEEAETGDQAHERADTDEDEADESEAFGGDSGEAVEVEEEIIGAESAGGESESPDEDGSEAEVDATETEGDEHENVEDEDEEGDDNGEESDEAKDDDEADADEDEDDEESEAGDEADHGGEDESAGPGDVETVETTATASAGVGVVSLDAHLGCRTVDGQPSNETAYRQLFEAGLESLSVVGARHFESSTAEAEYLHDQDGEIVTAEEVGEDPVTAADRALDALGDVDTVYVSVDLDVLDATAAPGVSAPTPGGISTRELFRLLRVLVSDDRLAGVEVVEAAPPLCPDGRTARAGARAVAHALSVAGEANS